MLPNVEVGQTVTVDASGTGMAHLPETCGTITRIVSSGTTRHGAYFEVILDGRYRRLLSSRTSGESNWRVASHV